MSHILSLFVIDWMFDSELISGGNLMSYLDNTEMYLISLPLKF